MKIIDAVDSVLEKIQNGVCGALKEGFLTYGNAMCVGVSSYTDNQKQSPMPRCQEQDDRIQFFLLKITFSPMQQLNR